LAKPMKRDLMRGLLIGVLLLLLAVVVMTWTAAGADPSWSTATIRNPGAQRTGIEMLDDIAQRTAPGYSYRRDLGSVHWAHETVHQLNSDMRNHWVRRYGGRVNAIYCGKGRVAVLEEPRLTLATVAAAVPGAFRGSTYNLYLVQQQQYWNQEPLYIFDEWACYLLGSQVALDMAQMGRPPPNESLTFENSVRFAAYGQTLLRLVRSRQADYRDLEKLEALTEWMAARTWDVLDRSAKYPALVSGNRQAIMGHYAATFGAPDRRVQFANYGETLR